jgi:hypothetical protein
MHSLSSSFFVPKQALRKAALVGASALAMVLVAGQAKANSLVINGSFEETSNGTNKQVAVVAGTPYAGQSASFTTLTGWTVVPGPLAVTSNNVNSYIFAFTAAGTGTGATNYYSSPLELWTNTNGGKATITSSPDGGNFVGGDGAFPTNGKSNENIASLQQTITGLTVGQTYALSFDWAAAQQHGYFGATTEEWSVSLGGQTQDTPVYDLASQSFSGWMGDTMYFTATSSSELLSFLAQGTPSETEPPFVLLDGVALNNITPEPGTLTLLLTGGIAGFGALNRRRLMRKGRKAAK